MNDLKYIAIVGVGRSGTTLLMSMLNAHPLIAFPPEFHFINQHLAKRPNAKFKEAFLRLKNDHRFRRLNIDLNDVMRPLRSKKTINLSTLYREILRCYAQRENVQIIGDKAPKNIEYLPVIRKIFPDAVIIHLIRDPRDVYLSRINAQWSSNRPDILQFLAYRAQYEMGRSFGNKLFGDNYIEIFYEDLITEPEKELHKICSLVGVRYTEKMLQFSQSAQKLVADDEMKWKKEVLGPLIATNMKKWMKKLNKKQIENIETACNTAFKDRLYQKSYPDNSIKKSIGNFGMAVLSSVYKANILVKNWKVNCMINTN